jgi:hypothetical protein
MIVIYNVCDNCSSQLEVMSGSAASGIEVTVRVRSVYEGIMKGNGTFFNNSDLNTYTFCDKNCYVEFLKKREGL